MDPEVLVDTFGVGAAGADERYLWNVAAFLVFMVPLRGERRRAFSGPLSIVARMHRPVGGSGVVVLSAPSVCNCKI